MNLLSLDLGTMCGWALDAQGVRESGVQTFDVKRGESPGMRFIRFARWLREIALFGNGKAVDLVVFEQAHHRGGAATAVSLGFQAHLLAFCAQFQIEHVAVHSGALKKWVTGKGNASKEEMVAAVARRFTDLGYRTKIEDDEADAIGLLEYAKVEIVGITAEAR